MTTPCPVTETVSGYLLRCVLPAGHGGEHWASELEGPTTTNSAQLPGQRVSRQSPHDSA